MNILQINQNDCMGTNFNKSIFLSPVTDTEIMNNIHQLKNSNSPGPDGTSNKFIK